MTKHQLNFFATAGDLRNALAPALVAESPRFALAGTSASPDVRMVDLGSLLPDRAYLIVGTGSEVRSRKITSSQGADRFAVDQMENPDTVSLRPGGLVGPKLLAGQLGTARPTVASLALLALLRTGFRDNFVKIKSYLVGPEAERLLDTGTPLVPSAEASIEYSLRR